MKKLKTRGFFSQQAAELAKNFCQRHVKNDMDAFSARYFFQMQLPWIANLVKPYSKNIVYDASTFFEVRRLFFAAGVLAVLAFLLVLSIAIYTTSSGPGETPQKVIFDSMTKIVPPIITLVLGYYFGQSSGARPPTSNQDPKKPSDDGVIGKGSGEVPPKKTEGQPVLPKPVKPGDPSVPNDSPKVT